MYSVYIIQSELDNSYYIGSSGNRENRLADHNNGRTRYTKNKKPWKLVYFEEYQIRGEAVKRERYLKRLKSRKYIEKLINTGR